MTLLWTTPREWAANDPITKERLNDISDNLLYLMSPSVQRATVRNGTNATTTSTTPVDMDAASYALSVELTGIRDVRVRLHGAVLNSNVAQACKLDIFIDGATYLSSLTGTPLTLGAWITTEFVAANTVAVDLMITIPAGVLAAGVHTFKPRFWTSANTMTWQEANLLTQFEVGEF